MKERLERHLRAIDESLAHLATTLRKYVLWPVFIAMAAGGSFWTARHTGRLAALAKNQLQEPERIALLWNVGGAALAWLLLLGAWLGIRRWRDRAWRTTACVAQLTRATSVLMAVPFVLALGLPKLEQTSPKLCLFFAACAAAACVPTWLALSGGRRQPLVEVLAPRWRRRLDRLTPWLAWLVVLGIAAGYAWFFSRASITNHHAFNTRTTDLGYYDNIFYQSAHGRPLACTFIRAGYHGSAHFDPILVLLAPIYSLAPRAETLLVMQSVWLACGALPVYLLGQQALRSKLAGIVLTAAYVLYPAMHGANMYEFHSLTLLATPLLWALVCLQRGAALGYAAAVVVCLLVREDAALVLCFVGAHALLTSRPQRRRWGWVTILVSLAYFAVVKKFFMTSTDIFMGGKDAYSFAYYYRDLIPEGQGVAGMLTSLVTNPVFAIQHSFTEDKLLFLLVLFGPLGLLPLFADRGRFMMLYGLCFLLLATREPVYSPYFQYAVVLFPFLFALAPVGIVRLEQGRLPGWLGVSARQLRTVALASVLLVSVLVSWKFGGFVENARFRGGFSRVARTLSDKQRENYDKFKELAAQIPRNASVTVTNVTGPHLSNRKDVYFYHQRKRTDWLFIDERDMKQDVKTWHQKRIQSGELEELGAVGTMKLFRVVPAKATAGGEPPPEATAATKEDKGTAERKGKRARGRADAGAEPGEEVERLQPPDGWRDEELGEPERAPVP